MTLSTLGKTLTGVMMSASISFCVAAKTTDSTAVNIGELNSQMQNWQDKYGLPSFSMAIALEGDLMYAGATGLADVENQIAASAATPYSVGSIAKSFTGVALARLVDQGKIKLTDKVSQYLPEHPQYKDITVQQLASHTGGITRPWRAREHREFTAPYDHSSPFQALDIVANEPLEFAAGESFQYSSMGYVVLSAVIEAAAGMSFDTYLKNQLFKPLNMTATELDNSTAGKGLEAHYYKEKSEDGGFIPDVAKRDRSFLFGGGGYISTPTDMVKLLSAFAKKDFISPEMQQALQTPIPLNNGEVNEQRYSLGWRVTEVEDAKHPDGKVLAIHHGGITSGAATGFVLLIPEYEAAIAYVTNTDPQGFWAVRQDTLALLLRLYHQ